MFVWRHLLHGWCVDGLRRGCVHLVVVFVVWYVVVHVFVFVFVVWYVVVYVFVFVVWY